MENRPNMVSPIMREARATVTMPVPRLMSQLLFTSPVRQPASPVRELATHSPTVMVKAGLMEEARTMSALSPVARMDRPSRVRKKSATSTAAAAKMAASTTRVLHPVQSSFPLRPLARDRRVSLPKMDRLEDQPITARLTVYSPVLTMMPARMLSTPSLVWRKAVTNPDRAPASMAAGRARKGCPARVTVAPTAKPRV